MNWDWMNEFRIPKLTSDAEIPVYLVHNSRDPDDYFFLFDFEEFVSRSEGGIFVRPKLRIHAGRDDFSRTQFARNFREVFAAEFDRMRSELANKDGNRGWLDWRFFGLAAIDIVGGLVANLLLAIALSVGRRVVGGIKFPRLLKSKSPEARLADEIERTKSHVEDALTRVDVTIHPELYQHAFRDGHMGRISGMDRDAWPLPAFVRSHLNLGKTASWW